MTAKASLEQLDHIGGIAAGTVRTGQRVGLGSGKAALSFVRALGKRMRQESLQLTCVPTSILTEQVAREAGIALSTLFDVDALDITVDGADEVDPALQLIKGGGGNLAREKVIAGITKKLVIVVGGEKIVRQLGTTFPVFVETIEFSRPVVTRKIEALGAKVTQRMNVDGSPFITDNGNPYLMAQFPPQLLSKDPASIDLAMRCMPGVVETGLFINAAAEVIVAHADGTVEHKHRPAGK